MSPSSRTVREENSGGWNRRSFYSCATAHASLYTYHGQRTVESPIPFSVLHPRRRISPPTAIAFTRRTALLVPSSGSAGPQYNIHLAKLPKDRPQSPRIVVYPSALPSSFSIQSRIKSPQQSPTLADPVDQQTLSQVVNSIFVEVKDEKWSQGERTVDLPSPTERRP